MKKSVKVASFIFIFVLILSLSTAFSFAFFTANAISEEAETIVVSGGKMTIDYDGGPDIVFSGIYPKNDPWASKEFTVAGTNTTELNMEYSLSLIISDNTFTDGSLVYSLTGTNNDLNGTLAPDISENGILSGARLISLGDGSFSSPTGTLKVHTYNLEIYFPDSGIPGAENINQGKSFKGRVNIANK